MELTMTVYGSTPHGRFGELVIGGEVFYTVERPWLGNAPSISCLPLGSYDLLWRSTTTPVPSSFGGHTWYLVGEGVSVRQEPGVLRYGCAIHIANTMDDVNGCIGLGLSPAYLSGKWAVGSSRDALKRVLKLLKPQDHQLHIVQAPCG